MPRAAKENVPESIAGTLLFCRKPRLERLPEFHEMASEAVSRGVVELARAFLGNVEAVANLLEGGAEHPEAEDNLLPRGEFRNRFLDAFHYLLAFNLRIGTLESLLGKALFE